MRVLHTITLPEHDLPESEAVAVRARLVAMGLLAPDSNLLNFQIYEDQPTWPEIAPMLDLPHSVDLCWTEFSAAELQAARWIELRPSWHHGYPMPDEDLGYRRVTYAQESCCPRCGGGAVQTAAFRMRGEPRWGRHSILQLNWVFDEFFVPPQLHEAVFAPLDISARDVLHHRTGMPLRTIVQIEAQPEEADLVLECAHGAACQTCGRFRYLPPGRVVPLVRSAPANRHYIRSRQVFGSGASTHRMLLISSQLYEALRKAGVRGMHYGAVALAGAA